MTQVMPALHVLADLLYVVRHKAGWKRFDLLDDFYDFWIKEVPVRLGILRFTVQEETVMHTATERWKMTRRIGLTIAGKFHMGYALKNRRVVATLSHFVLLPTGWVDAVPVAHFSSDPLPSTSPAAGVPHQYWAVFRLLHHTFSTFLYNSRQGKRLPL